jgi:hypothetical protein
MKRILAALIVMLGLVLPAAPASGAAPTTCALNYICFADGSDLTPRVQKPYNVSTGTCFVWNDAVGFQVDYVSNSTNTSWNVWTGYGCGSGTQGRIWARSHGSMCPGTFCNNVHAFQRTAQNP